MSVLFENSPDDSGLKLELRTTDGEEETQALELDSLWFKSWLYHLLVDLGELLKEFRSKFPLLSKGK